MELKLIKNHLLVHLKTDSYMLRLTLFILLGLLSSLSAENKEDKLKPWYGLLYLSYEHDTNPVQLTSQNATDVDDTLGSAYLNLGYIWNSSHNKLRGKHELNIYESRYKENDTLNLRSLSFKENLVYRTKTKNTSLQLKNTFSLTHLDVDDTDYLWIASYKPEILIYHKPSKLY